MRTREARRNIVENATELSATALSIGGAEAFNIAKRTREIKMWHVLNIVI